MISLILLLSLLTSPKTVEKYYKPYITFLSEVDSGKVWIEYDKSISREMALQIFQHLHANPERERKMGIYRIPKSDTYLCSINGQQLVQLKNDSTGFNEVFRSPIIDLSWILKPSFFVNDSSIIVISEFGEENWEGFLVHELINGILRQLDQCDFVPLDSKVMYDSPSEHITIRKSVDRLFLEFKTDVIVNPLTSKEKILYRNSNKINLFMYNDSNFVNLQ